MDTCLTRDPITGYRCVTNHLPLPCSRRFSTPSQLHLNVCNLQTQNNKFTTLLQALLFFFFFFLLNAAWFPSLSIRIITGNPPRPFMDRRWKPTVELAPNCPRCNSSNTKFCYYNNYSLTQPRYFCKSCRRYWTKGGSLRNVPVGGGCRKNRRAKSGSVTASLISRCSLPDSDRSRTSDPLVNWQASESENLANDDKSSTINLALVYSKLLNQENLLHIDQDSSFVVPEIHNQFEPPVNLTTTQSQFVHQNNMVQCGDYSGLAADDIGNHVLLGEFEPNQYYDQQQRIEQQPMNSDFINLGFQPMPNSGVLQDIFISSLQLPQPPLIEPADNSSLYPKFSDLFSSL